jgi:hypothetical protein
MTKILLVVLILAAGVLFLPGPALHPIDDESVCAPPEPVVHPPHRTEPRPYSMYDSTRQDDRDQSRN